MQRMRAGLSTIQQTLTPDAAAVLNRSIGEAARRSHGQTTPLHVAATLLSAPTGLLRQACIRSHPTSSHPLQCRALELCFSVALDRLPSVSGAGPDPPISNALMAALKRAQAHQRRGCPEQQQQPLLAVKVELEQLVVSILDDPSVSRVMREASFSSPAVKATIEQSLASSPSSSSASPSPSAASSSLGLGSLGLSQRPAPAARNLYMNPRLHQQQVASVAGAVFSRSDEVKRVLDIMARPKKRNPVLVADADPAAVLKEVIQRIQSGDAPQPLRAAQMVSFEKELGAVSDRSAIPAKITEIGGSIDAMIDDFGGPGVVLDLGDLKWLVESPGGAGTGVGGAPVRPIQQQIVTESGRAAVAEMAKLVARFAGKQVWMVGTATCATYLRCQVYHPTMESDWDIQAVPIAPRSTHLGMFQRIAGNGILSSSIEYLNPTRGLPALAAEAATTTSQLRRSPPECSSSALCSECIQSYERELAKLVADEFAKSSSSEAPQSSLLPHWLQAAKPAADQFKPKEEELKWKQSIEQLLARWRETCSRLHPKPHPMLVRPPQSLGLQITATSNSVSKFASCPPIQSKLTLSQSVASVQLSSRRDELLRLAPPRPSTPPGSPVITDLVLGRPKLLDSTMDNAHIERVKDSAGCRQDVLSEKHKDKATGVADFDSFKRLFKGLADRVGWQSEAASTIAEAVMQCKSGNGKPRGTGPRGDTWLLFVGPDKVGKRKMAAALSELMFGAAPTIVHLSSRPRATAGESERMSFRGRTSADRIVDAIRRNPFSVLVLDDIDQADVLTRGSIKRAIDKGRMADSQGREVSLGSVVFVLTANWVPDELKSSHDSALQSEERMLESANSDWLLELSVGDRGGAKRAAEKVCAEGQPPAKLRKEDSVVSGGGLSLDLNLAAGMEDDANEEGSRNSSDVTVEHEQEPVRLAITCAAPSSTAAELMEFVDEAVVFKPVDFAPLRRKVLESVSSKFTSIVGSGKFILVDEGALDRMVGGAWLAGAAATTGAFDEWIDRVIVPSMQQLKASIRAGDGTTVVRLSAVKGSGRRRQAAGDWLPETVAIALGGK